MPGPLSWRVVTTGVWYSSNFMEVSMKSLTFIIILFFGGMAVAEEYDPHKYDHLSHVPQSEPIQLEAQKSPQTQWLFTALGTFAVLAIIINLLYKIVRQNKPRS